ncbi:MAG: tail fiber protein [Proteobacteria bacterium]|nr:tail fiber protein [Pseudomonadota bacterium]MBI3495944.1 tail fiber protein [Pseudomonadota bacterium]
MRDEHCDALRWSVKLLPELAALYGNTYSGDGRETFAMPTVHDDYEALAGNPTSTTLIYRCIAIKKL